MESPRRLSDTYRKIWSSVEKIPPGKVSTYGDIADISGFVGEARLVGYALHALPRGSDVPWHRVINRHGRIALPAGHGHRELQKRLLEKEGVLFRGEKVELETFRWGPRGLPKRK
jgi:methylated-DNA-protein-cysteine methyltransferase related protein